MYKLATTSRILRGLQLNYTVYFIHWNIMREPYVPKVRLSESKRKKSQQNEYSSLCSQIRVILTENSTLWKVLLVAYCMSQSVLRKIPWMSTAGSLTLAILDAIRWGNFSSWIYFQSTNGESLSSHQSSTTVQCSTTLEANRRSTTKAAAAQQLTSRQDAK